MCGLYFALRSGQEHCQLRFKPFQPTGGRRYLQYTEDISKNRPGGLKGHKIKPKHHANPNIAHCFVHFFKLYMEKCPPNRPHEAFNLRPLNIPTTDCWYSIRPLGHQTLGKTIACLCKKAGITWFKTNHSL